MYSNTTNAVSERLLTVREAAARIGVGRARIFEMLKDGTLQRVSLGTRSTRIPESSLAAFITKAMRKGAA